MSLSQRATVHQLYPERDVQDAELLSALERGDERAARALVSRFGALVNRVVRVALGPDQEHDDVVHAAYCEILTHVNQVREPSKLEGWVRIVTLNTARSVLRKRTVRRRYDGTMPDLDRYERDQDASRHESRELLAMIYGILSTFNEVHRTMFTLRFIEQLSIPEIAALCEVSESTAKRKINKAQRLFLARARAIPALAERISEGSTWSLPL